MMIEKHDRNYLVIGHANVYDPHSGGGLAAVHEKYRKQYRFGFQKELR
jgi:hypothetical protein